MVLCKINLQITNKQLTNHNIPANTQTESLTFILALAWLF